MKTWSQVYAERERREQAAARKEIWETVKAAFWLILFLVVLFSLKS